MMRNKCRTALVHIFLTGAALSALFGRPGNVSAQTPAEPGSIYWQPSQIPFALQYQFLALGNRLQSAGSERITISAIVSDSSRKFPAQVVMEKGGKLRIDTASQTLAFDGKHFSREPDSTEEEIVESLVDDLPETLIEAAASGNGIRLLGERFSDNSGASCDLYDAVIPRKTNQKLPQQVKRYCFDSRTKLLSWVQYARGPKADGQLVETHFASWVRVNGQSIAAVITRKKGGKDVFTLEAQEIKVSSRKTDNLFKP